MAVNKDGFPRLPYTKFWPDKDQVDRLLARAQSGDAPIPALRDLFALIATYQTLQRRNTDWQSRQWGLTDVAEENSEHWNYVRNSDFLQGTNGAYKWAANAALTRSIATTGLPYGVARGGSIQDTSGAKNWVQQSASANGNIWYGFGGFVAVPTGTTAGFDVVENSGSVSGRTHSLYQGTTVMKRLQGAFRTYKGTTKLTFRCVVAASATGVFAHLMLEKGRRLHAWRKHLMDRGNYITSLKTANSASFWGNITLSASGGAAIRQKATKTFVFGAPTVSGGKPKPVSTSGTAGILVTYSRADHVHRGVKAIKTTTASADGTVAVSASGTGSAVRMTGAKLIVGPPKPATATPSAVSTSGAVGTGTLWARTDHRHRGVKTVKYGATSNSGTVSFSGSGTAASMGLAWSGSKLKIGFPKAATATPAPASTSGTVGTGTLWARTDHRHRGVKTIKYGTTSTSGTVAFSGSGTGGALAWSGSKLKIGWPKPATATPSAVSTSGAVGTGTLWARTDHRHRGVKAAKYGGTSNSGTISFSGSGTATSMGLAWSGKKLKIGFPKAATATPTAPSTSGTVGIGTLWARTDHRHRGVKALRIRGAQGSAAGTVRLSQSSNVTVRLSGQTAIIGATGGGGTGRYIGTTVLTSGTSFTTGATTKTLKIRVQAGGGGGGGVSGALGQIASAGGGAAGGYAEKTFSVSSSTAYTYAIGLGGAGGAAAGANAGAAGGNSAFTVGATTVTAFGGPGGTGAASGTATAIIAGGAAPVVSTNGDVNASGAPGGYSLQITTVIGESGGGGSCLFGAGGTPVQNQATGLSGVGKGAGGSGGTSFNNGAGAAGGAGLAGIIVVDEYT